MPAKEWVFVNGITRSSICHGAVQALQLPERYQLEIDRLTMGLGLTGTDEYLNQWLGVTIDMFPTSQAKSCSTQLKSKKILPAG